ncbi:MAG: DsbA family protein [Nanobdellota archaeon]
MKSKTKSILATLIIIVVIAVIAFLVLSKKPPVTDAETAQCIGSKSVLYTQLGCHFCEVQEEMFGENYQYLNVVDCWYNHQACIDYNITGTPTWIVKNKKYEGVQTIDKLKEITGC